MFNIDEIFDMLSWNSDKNIQKKGIEEAKKIKHLSVLIQPMESKDIWENCAKVLAEKRNDELLPYTIELFKWLQDMNWPGAEIIYDRLKMFSFKAIEPQFDICLSLADKYGDISWKQVLMDFKGE